MKRLFDIIFSSVSLLILSWLIVVCFIIASIETKSNGFFVQKRVGQWGKLFWIFKIKTIDPRSQKTTFFGYYFRRYKLDEIPQFLNVLLGDMSVVGPRPDVQGYYDLLQGEDRKVLALKPGITSEASIKYSNEDEILNQQENPLEYNDKIIFPDKIRMNLAYFHNHTFVGDLKIIFRTMVGSSENKNIG